MYDGAGALQSRQHGHASPPPPPSPPHLPLPPPPASQVARCHDLELADVMSTPAGRLRDSLVSTLNNRRAEDLGRLKNERKGRLIGARLGQGKVKALLRLAPPRERAGGPFHSYSDYDYKSYSDSCPHTDSDSDSDFF